MNRERTSFDQRVVSGVDLAIDFATLGEYGLALYTAAGPRREPTERRSRRIRRPGWEALATVRRGACASDRSSDPFQWRFPRDTSRANFRAAVERYAA